MQHLTRRDAAFEPPPPFTYQATDLDNFPEWWLDSLVERVELQPHGVIVPLGSSSHWDEERLTAMGAAVVTALLRRMRQTSTIPGAARLSVEGIEQATVPSGVPWRTYLPHTEGQHCSYLTPSTIENPLWDPRLRSFTLDVSARVCHGQKTHQALLFYETGGGDGATTFYDLVRILTDAYLIRTGRVGTATEIAGWVGENICFGLSLQPETESRYLSLGTLLGSREPCFALTKNDSKAVFGVEEHKRFPDLAARVSSCECGHCDPEMERLLCHSLVDAMGVTWQEFRRRYEVQVQSEPGDLLIARNLTLLHGAYRGRRTRRFRQFFFSIAQPEGVEYEAWLSAKWRRHVARSRRAALTPQHRTN